MTPAPSTTLPSLGTPAMPGFSLMRRRLPRMLPVARPRLSPARAVLPYLQRIDANAWYSNHGPLAVALQARLADHWGLPNPAVALFCNATSAITLALLASGARRGTRCLMPSWTFIASAGAVYQAGLVPHFVDVQPETWAPDPDELERLASQGGVGAILVVAPFGAPIDLARWDAVQRTTGVPVIIDAAAAFDTMRRDGPMTLGECPVIISLHATKVFGIGEGGALLSRDPALIDQARRLAQFGFLGTREAMAMGFNAKLSEYAAAVGLAGLDTWQETRMRWAVVTNRYRTRLSAVPGIGMTPGFGNGWVASTLSILWPTNRPDPASALTQHRIETLRWWGPGCHAQPAYADCPTQPMPVTTATAAQTLGLPFWQDLGIAQIDAVCDTLAALAQPTPAARRPRPVPNLVHAHG